MQSSGRGRSGLGERPHLRRELPRPGTTMGFSMNSRINSMPIDPIYIDSEDEEDWC